MIKEFWDDTKIVLTMLVVTLAMLSFSFSIVRLIEHDECHWEYKANNDPRETMVKVCPTTPCKPLFIDKFEPFISTRWFCELP